MGQAVLGIFAFFIGLIALGILVLVILVAVFTGQVLENVLKWALSSLNFGKILEQSNASNKANFNNFKDKIKKYLTYLSYFGAPAPKKGNTKTELYKQFFEFVILKLVAVLFQTLLGVHALWLCKVAQTNILPSDYRGAPYTDLPPIINSIITQVNFFKQGEETWSTKLLFPYLYIPDRSSNDSKPINSQFSVLNTLRELNESPSISGTAMFFIYMIESLFCVNYYTINMFFSFFNTFYEWFIVLFGGYLIMFTVIANLVLSNLCFIYTFFSGIFSWIWKINKPEKVMEDGLKLEKPNVIQHWFYISLTQMPLTWFSSLIETIFLLNCFIPFILIGNTFVFHIVILYCLISSVFIIAKVADGERVGQDYSFSTLYINKMRYMLMPVFLLMSIFVVIGANAYLGKTERNAAIVAGIIVLIILSNIPTTNISNLGSKDTKLPNFEQAEKRVQYKLSSNVIWALTGTIDAGDFASNITNQINKLTKFDNYVKKNTPQNNNMQGGGENKESNHNNYTVSKEQIIALRKKLLHDN
jgi:hypothetical protein